MSVLIKGMEMPKNCGECRLCENSGGAFELGNDYCCLTDIDVTDLDTVPNWCPLIFVPEHGRLIDADKLGYSFDGFRDVLFREDIEEALTIIEAEEADNGQN